MMDPFNDEYFMKQALVEARSAAEEGEVPVGAVIVCNNPVSYTHLSPIFPIIHQAFDRNIFRNHTVAYICVGKMDKTTFIVSKQLIKRIYLGSAFHTYRIKSPIKIYINPACPPFL